MTDKAIDRIILTICLVVGMTMGILYAKNVKHKIRSSSDDVNRMYAQVEYMKNYTLALLHTNEVVVRQSHFSPPSRSLVLSLQTRENCDTRMKWYLGLTFTARDYELLNAGKVKLEE